MKKIILNKKQAKERLAELNLFFAPYLKKQAEAMEADRKAFEDALANNTLDKYYGVHDGFDGTFEPNSENVACEYHGNFNSNDYNALADDKRVLSYNNWDERERLRSHVLLYDSGMSRLRISTKGFVFDEVRDATQGTRYHIYHEEYPELSIAFNEYWGYVEVSVGKKTYHVPISKKVLFEFNHGDIPQRVKQYRKCCDALARYFKIKSFDLWFFIEHAYNPRNPNNPFSAENFMEVFDEPGIGYYE